MRAVKPGVWNKRWRGVRVEVKHEWGLVCDSAFVPTLGYQTTLACSKRYQPVLLGKSGDHVLSALKEKRVFDRALKIPVDHLKFFGDCFRLSFSEIPSIFTGGQGWAIYEKNEIIKIFRKPGNVSDFYRGGLWDHGHTFDQSVQSAGFRPRCNRRS